MFANILNQLMNIGNQEDNNNSNNGVFIIEPIFQKNNLNIYYSPYGYINLDDPNKTDQLYSFTQYKLSKDFKNPLKGTIHQNNIYNTIKIKVKTFFNERAIYTLENIDILSPLHKAIEKLFIQKKEKEKEKNIKLDNMEHITNKTQYRIFSSHKSLHELDITKCVYENELQDNELLIYLPIQELSFSQHIKGNSVLISQKNKIASKVNTDAPQYVLGDDYYFFGKHYFEIYLLTVPIGTSIIIGVATKRNQRDKYTYDVNNFYGLIISDMTLIWTDRGKQLKKDFNKNKKENFAINDIVGVMLNFKKEGLEISFYKNKILLGLAYSKIPENVFYPAVSLGIAGSKVQISNQIEFP